MKKKLDLWAVCKILSLRATKEKAQGSIKALLQGLSGRELNLEMLITALCLGIDLKQEMSLGLLEHHPLVLVLCVLGPLQPSSVRGLRVYLWF